MSASYSGDSTYAPGTSTTLTQTVNNELASSVVVAGYPNPSTFGASVTFMATVMPSSCTGSVTFKDGATTLGTGTISGGTATYSTSTLAVGSHPIRGSYSGDSNCNSSTSASLSQTVSGSGGTLSTGTTLTSSLNPSTYGNCVTFTGDRIAFGGERHGDVHGWRHDSGDFQPRQRDGDVVLVLAGSRLAPNNRFL